MFGLFVQDLCLLDAMESARPARLIPVVAFVPRSDPQAWRVEV